MICFPQCKINIGLNIHSKREDGYHEISSVMYPLQWQDVLEIVPGERFNFTHSGLDIPGEASTNLCVKAFNLLNAEQKITPVHAHLRKNIPMGGGLGGGSANATAMLRLLDEYNELNLSDDQLRSYAAQLGSDCPFFVVSKPQFATGRGELLEPISVDLSGYYLLLVNDGTHVSTKEAYSSVVPRKPLFDLRETIKEPIERWQESIQNQFEESVFPHYPHLAKIKEELLESGATYASMSGSGATLYGIFKREPKDWEEKYNKFSFAKLIQL